MLTVAAADIGKAFSVPQLGAVTLSADEFRHAGRIPDNEIFRNWLRDARRSDRISDDNILRGWGRGAQCQ